MEINVKYNYIRLLDEPSNIDYTQIEQMFLRKVVNL